MFEDEEELVINLTDEELANIESKFNDHDINNIFVMVHSTAHFDKRVKERVERGNKWKFTHLAMNKVRERVRDSHLHINTGEVSMLFEGKRYRIVFERNGKRDFALVTVKTPNKEYDETRKNSKRDRRSSCR